MTTHTKLIAAALIPNYVEEMKRKTVSKLFTEQGTEVWVRVTQVRSLSNGDNIVTFEQI
jgi:hypothetical protein